MMSGDDGDGAAEGNHDSDDVMHQVEEVSTRTPTADDICQAAADILDVHYDESIQVADLLDAVELNLDVGQGSLVRWTNHFATLLRERRPVVDTGGLSWRNKTAPAASIPRHRPPANSTWDPYAGAVTDKEGNIVRYNGAWVSKGGSEDGDEGGPSEAMTASAAPKRLGRPRRDNTADKCTDTGPVPAKPPRGPKKKGHTWDGKAVAVRNDEGSLQSYKGAWVPYEDGHEASDDEGRHSPVDKETSHKRAKVSLTHASTHACTNAYTHEHTHVCMRVKVSLTHASTHTCTNAYTHEHTHVCMRVRTHAQHSHSQL